MFNNKEERYQDFLKLCRESDFYIENRVQQWLLNNGLFTAPASTKYHGAYEGGLYDHSRQVYLRLKDLTEKLGLEWSRKQSPFVIGMFHDLCKCDQYIAITSDEYESGKHGKLEPKEKIIKYEYNQNTLLKGHAIKSIVLLSQLFPITEEEMLCIRYHMGAYGNENEQKEEWIGFDKAIHKYSNVLYAHTADMLASKVDDM